MEYINCPLCNTDNTRLLFKRKDHLYCLTDYQFNVVRCKNCRFVYVNPRPNEAEMQNYYPEEFYDVGIDAEELLREKEGQLDLKNEYIKGIPPGTMLDIGCQKGEFMYFMKQRGWDVHGTEFSSKPPNVFGLDIYYGDLFEAEYETESFDLVTLWAVLEHVHNPKNMLHKIYHLLKPGGKMVLLTTNFNSLPAFLMRHDDIPRHLNLFTKNTMKRMLEINNFVPVSFHFNCELFGGNNRGIFNYLFKILMGEKIEDIVTYNRSSDLWYKFSSQLKGKNSSLMLKVDNLDIALSPVIDKIMDFLNLGFIMIASATKN